MEDYYYLTGLDIGTTKIGCIIAEISPEDEINIVGVAAGPCDGLRYGVVVDVEKTVRSIVSTVERAEQMADIQVDTVFAGIAGDHIRSINGRGVVAISGENGEVTQDDVRRVIDAAKAVALPIDREIIHILPQEFIVDDQRGIRDPLAMTGVRLEAEVHIVTGAIASAQNIQRCISKAGYRTADLVLEPLASSFSVLSGDEKELGVVVIDIGGGTTDLALFYEGCIRHTAVVGLGGRNVTNDIAIVLRTPVDSAEVLKVGHGSAIHSADDKNEMIQVPGVSGRPSRRVSKALLVDIIQPRMVEILTLANEEIKKSDYANLMTTGIVLTGGACLLPGIVELAEDIFNMPIKIGIPGGFGGLIEEASTPIHATGVGLVMYGAKHKHEIQDGIGAGEDGMFDKIKGRMRRWFGSVSTVC